MTEIIYKEETYKIQGAVYEVYKELGCGFLESVYQECLEREFALQGIEFITQHKLNLSYKGVELRQTFIPDFICYGKIILEIKAIRAVSKDHKAQVMNYLKATGMRLGLLINFGHYPKVELIRIAL